MNAPTQEQVEKAKKIVSNYYCIGNPADKNDLAKTIATALAEERQSAMNESAPVNQVVNPSAPTSEGFEEWKERNLTIGHDGLIKAWTYKMRGKFTSELSFDIFEDCFKAGQASRNIRLPEKYTSQQLISGGYEHGFNECLDAIKRLNAGATFKIEGE